MTETLTLETDKIRDLKLGQTVTLTVTARVYSLETIRIDVSDQHGEGWVDGGTRGRFSIEKLEINA